MTLDIISYIGNEEDIVEDFIRFHASFASHMHVICTADSDDTAAILARLSEEGLPLSFTLHRAAYHDQSVMLTRLMHRVAQQRSPDWLLPLDADEFLQGQELHSFGKLPADKVTLLPWKTYVPTACDENTGSVIERLTHRRLREHPQFYKVLVPGPLAGNITIDAGNHSVRHADTREPLPAHLSADLHLAHFPVRTEKQLRAKVTTGWKRTAANPLKGERENFHWKSILDQLENRRITPEELTAFAVQYAGGSGSASDIILDPVRTHT